MNESIGKRRWANRERENVERSDPDRRSEHKSGDAGEESQGERRNDRAGWRVRARRGGIHLRGSRESCGGYDENHESRLRECHCG